MSKHPRKLVVYISIIKMKIINSHAALRLFWRLVNHVSQLSAILVVISPCHMYWSRISLPAPAIRRSVLSVCKICSAFRFCIYLYCGFVREDKRRSWRKQKHEKLLRCSIWKWEVHLCRICSVSVWCLLQLSERDFSSPCPGHVQSFVSLRVIGLRVRIRVVVQVSSLLTILVFVTFCK